LGKEEEEEEEAFIQHEAAISLKQREIMRQNDLVYHQQWQ
jgi:hypothetical protein